ncbi:DNA polymerase III subunit alpha [Spiroplasma tabanidicola]|uniref:DNA polymerase III subunit alpha n=1 Tax=Spiroplasma tabanidicola TaxID=324079 RepID=A0A6I6CD76_9MOLU|nr:DNA polymerase III subunit alpha [Spiroplasma tabanidicola]QGS52258.1 DNA polymerase III subunit alpha [Spiroplasma tabanidicola]
MSYSNLLNIKSCFNFLKSTIKPQDYIVFLNKNKLNVGFYSDLNTMYGAAEFENLAKKNNIKPIIGVSFKLTYGDIVLYAINNKGYKVISYLSSFISNMDRIDSELFEKELYKQSFENIIAIFCPSVENLINFKDKLNNCFKNLYYGITKQNYKYLKENKIIYANQISYLYEDDFFEYKVINAISEAKLVNEVNDLEKDFYLSNEDLKNYIDIDTHNKNMNEIISIVEDDVINDFKTHFLTYPNALNMPSKNYLEKICNDKLDDLKLNTQEYKERLSLELDVIFKMGFEDYFLIVSDMINKAKELNILVGPGRGSAAGSLVSYLLGITKLDPIKWGLLFERFLNIDRVTLPDIDIDFQDDRREEILEYLFSKYGKNHFATITTFQTIGIKNALRDCGRVFEIDIDDVNHMSKQINDRNILDFDKALSDSKILQKYQNKYPQVFEAAKKIVGLPRQTGTHAAGVVFCDENLWDIVPTKVGISGILQTQYSMNYLENIGLIKTDILGLRNLSIIQEVLKLVYQSKKVRIDLDRIELNDKNTFELLRSGDTTGIFQLESNGMTDVLMQMKVNSVEEIAITSSLFRPGPKENIPLYIKRKNSKTKNYIIDSNLEDILDSTYGIIVYQEQVMEILKRVANFSLGKADIVRRAMGKKDAKLMDQFKNEFIQNAIKNNYTDIKANELWHYIERFAEYGFNKSHAIAYSLIGYWMAYLKTNYKAEFYCALLNGVLGNESKTSKYLSELKKNGYNINGPSIKNPNSIYYFSNNFVNMPLNIIKGIGPEFLNTIKKIYINNKKAFDNLFTIIAELLKNGLTEPRYLALVYTGAFDCYGYSRKVLIDNKNTILNLTDFIDITNENEFEIDLPEEKDSPESLALYEKEYLGFYISSHPLTLIREKLVNKEKLFYISNLKKENIVCEVFVTIDNIVTKTDKNGGQMCFVDVSDETGEIIVTVFASVYEKIKEQIKLDQKLIIRIKSQVFNNKVGALLLDVVKVIK